MNDVALPVAHADTILSVIERLARSTDVDTAHMKAMLDMFNAERDRQQRREFDDAMSALQSEIFEISTSGRNPTFRTAYPKLHDLIKESRPFLAKHGFSIRFGTTLQKIAEQPALQSGCQRIVLTISHVGGHWEESHMDGAPDISRSERVPRSPIQSIGSTNTYLRRYLYMMALNLVPGGDPTDDDGRGAIDASITPEQVREITSHIADLSLTPQEVENLLLAVEAQTIPGIPARHYARVVNTLINRKKRQQSNEQE